MATKDFYTWDKLKEKERLTFDSASLSTKKFLKKSAQFAVNSLSLLKRLSKRQRFKLSKIKPYLHKNEIAKLIALIKQGKANIELKRFGWSFLISGKDLLPVLYYIPVEKRKFIFDESEERSDELFIIEANKKIQKAFYKNAFEDFSERAWGALPQYIAPTLVSPVYIKQAIALQFFCSKDFKILLRGGRIRNKLISSAAEIDSSLVVADLDELSNREVRQLFSAKKILAGSKNNKVRSYKNFNIVIPVKKISLKKFTDLVESLVIQEVKINKNDIFFLKRYIKHAQKIKVGIPPHLADKIKLFALNLKKKNKKISQKTIEGILEMVKASAAMELRNEVETKDLERVFKIFKEVYWK